MEPEEKDQVLDHARKRAPEIKQKFQERKDNIKKTKVRKTLRKTEQKRVERNKTKGYESRVDK